MSTLSIKDFLIQNIPSHPSDIVSVASAHFHVTRTTIHRHLGNLINTRVITKTGTTKSTAYYIKSKHESVKRYSLNQNIDEFFIWRDEFREIFSDLPKNLYVICEYSFTEILNNAKDHSNGTWVKVSVSNDKKAVIICIEDDGIGIFRKLQQYFNLTEMRESILELSKGKVTTNPADHTGEGVFFTSRSIDVMKISANGIAFIRDNDVNDWFIKSEPFHKGTKVTLKINHNNQRSLTNIFKKYQDDESLAFDKTEIVIKLAQLDGERYISRSQAKRVLRNLDDKFTLITLDFSGVIIVGQGFVDEVFRVYQNKHPNVKITYMNANDDVLFMIKRSLHSSR